MTNRERIRTKAVELLSAAPEGIRFGALRRQIADALPDIPFGTVHGSLWNLEARLPDEVTKPARGLFLHTRFNEHDDRPATPPQIPSGGFREDAYYEPFAEWLVAEVEECTRAIPVGGNRFRSKWGTPDVIGVREPRKSDIVKAPTEVVAAEIKLDTQGLIVAFGQACSYKLFSHKSYIVVPRSAPKEDVDRLDALSLIFGIGLVLFDKESPAEPDFAIRVRPLRHEPDTFYVNQNLKLVEDELFG